MTSNTTLSKPVPHRGAAGNRAQIEDVRELLDNHFYTVTQAFQEIRRRFPGQHYSYKQLVRAIENDRIRTESVGRMRYIEAHELENFIGQLGATSTQPDKLRLQPPRDSYPRRSRKRN